MASGPSADLRLSADSFACVDLMVCEAKSADPMASRSSADLGISADAVSTM
jgi:hypothetical protein